MVIYSTDTRFAAALASLTEVVGSEVADLFGQIRAADPFKGHLRTLKVSSNSAKYCALAPPIAAIDVAEIASPVGRVTFDVPEGHFERNDVFEIHHMSERFYPLATELLIALRFSGLDEDDGSDPMSVFTSGSGHVAAVLTAVASHFGGLVFRPSAGRTA